MLANNLKNQSLIFKTEKGISLYFTILILSILTAIGIGLSVIIFSQIQMTRGIGNSVIALHAADSGVEIAIYDLYKGVPQSYYGPVLLSNGALFEARVYQPIGSPCQIGGIPESNNCRANCYCIKSIGTYQGVKRALEASF